MNTTSSTLLEQIKDPEDHQAWARFCALYEPMLRGWIRRGGVPLPDVDDLVQEALTSVARAMPPFRYERGKGGGFRGYLRIIVRNKLMDYWRKKKRHPPHTPFLPGFEPESRDPSGGRWDPDDAWLLEQLLRSVREQVDDLTWQVFVAYQRERTPAKEVAVRFNLTAAAVTARAWKVMSLLREAARALDPDLWPES
jgi:RNA polymerase sigma factor (sigma-70 family)